MKFRVKGIDLNEILTTTIKGFDDKEDNSYIAFKIDEETGKLIVTSRSRSAFFEGSISAFNIELNDTEPRIYHLDGVKLKQLISILPKSPIDIDFEITENTRSFTIKFVGNRYQLPVLSETPLAPTPEVSEYAEVDAVELMDILKDLIKIPSTDAAAQEHQFSCVHYNLSEDKLKMTATDSYALGIIEQESFNNKLEDELDVLVRHSEVSMLIDNFAQGEVLTLVGSNEMFGYIDESGTLSLVAKMNLAPINAEGIKAFIKTNNQVTVDKNEFRVAIDTVAKLSMYDETVVVEFFQDEERIRVSNMLGDHVDVHAKEASVTAPGTASFLTSVLKKSLLPAANGDIILEIGDLTEDADDLERGALHIVPLEADGSRREDMVLISAQLER